MPGIRSLWLAGILAAAVMSATVPAPRLYAQEDEGFYQADSDDGFLWEEEAGLSGDEGWSESEEEGWGVGESEEGWATDEFGMYDDEYEWESDDESFDGWYGDSEQDWSDWSADLF